MVTLIFDIDGTLTDMWPLERTVLGSMLGPSAATKLDQLKASGLGNLYLLYRKLSVLRLTKAEFRFEYARHFGQLRAAGLLPPLKSYRAVEFIHKYCANYCFVYATGGMKAETEYVLASLGVLPYFDLTTSTSNDTCRFAKSTGRPYRTIKRRVGSCCVISDSPSDAAGAALAEIPSLVISPDAPLTGTAIQRAIWH